MRNLVIKLIINISFVIVVLSQEGAINLKRDLFSNYDSQSRPIENISQKLNICAGLYVLQIVGLSERSQVYIKGIIWIKLLFLFIITNLR
jgi:hypothetical protein